MPVLPRRLSSLTVLRRASLFTFVVGTTLDLFYHVAPPAWLPTIEQYLGPDGSRAHLITFVGMVLILASVLNAAFAARGPTHERKGGGIPRICG